jgi:hypothetical protein
LHNLVMELSPGGIAKELNASDAVAVIECVQPGTPVEAAREVSPVIPAGRAKPQEERAAREGHQR